MREIKFRAKSLDGDLVYFGLYEVTNYFLSDGVFYVGGVPCQIGSEQEYTGLKDKNGREIYEGDIAKRVDRVVGKIVFKDCSYIFQPENDYGFSMHTMGSYELEVIGNIYENPELIEVEK